MSYQATRWACGQRAGSAPAKAVLMVLAEHSDKAGLSWPSTRTIADEAECDQRTVRRHLDALRDRGLVAVQPGAGKASNRYQLAMDAPVVRRSDASTNETVVRHPDASLPSSADSPSEAHEIASEALDLRSEATRASDQQRSEQNNYVEPVTTEQAATPPRGRGGARPREAFTPAELARTAHSGSTHALVSGWGTGRSLLGPQKRELMRAVDLLLTQGADPALVPAALDEAHDNPEWKNPAASLRYAYERVIRDQMRGDRPLAAVTPIGTSSLRANAILALRKGDAS